MDDNKMTEEELLKLLNSYRRYYYDYLYTVGKMESIRSPSFTDEPKVFGHSDKISEYDSSIERKREFEDKMQVVIQTINLLKPYDYFAYQIIDYKHIWELENGPVPKGYNLTFRDGDADNICIDNIVLITTRQKIIMTKNKLYHKGNKELNETGINIAKVLDKYYKLKK